ncbi:MAG: response regulator [Deltaproteobacteria bacterium]|nr:response regulator [Deltaproteobacteria bacterium]
MMTSENDQILVVDDEEVICTLLITALMDKGYEVVAAKTRADARKQIEKKHFDLLIVDKNLPDGTGFDIVAFAREVYQDFEAILMTGYSDTDSAIQAVESGFFRYTRKPLDLKSFLLDIDKALETTRLRRALEQRSSELAKKNEELLQNEQRFRMLFNSGNDAVLVYPLPDSDVPTKLVEANDQACRWLGCTHDALLNLSIHDVTHPDYLQGLSSVLERLREEKQVIYESILIPSSGDEIPVEISSRVFEFRNQVTVFDVIRNVIERHRNEEERSKLEHQFHESQKMEAIGQLAGGIAHDMNNVLGAITGFASALNSDMQEGSDDSDLMLQDVQEILSACRRGRDLTRDLLGYARKGNYQKETISLNNTARDVSSILARTIPKTIIIKTDFEDDLGLTECDPGQLNHAVMNICINAVDAMQGRGILKLTTRNVEFDQESSSNHTDLKPENHVLLEVCDTGTGMNEETLNRAIEPFFTTKPAGKGTGLGLAMVFGAIKNHHGALNISSEVGVGTTVRIYLPVARVETEDQGLLRKKTSIPPSWWLQKKPSSTRVDSLDFQNDPRSTTRKDRSKTVLLVDDELMIRNSGKRLLNQLGYDVLLAENGKEAVDLYAELSDTIEVIILDLIMPVMDGEEAFLKLREIDPMAKILLASGYSKAGKAAELIELGAKGFMSKPFGVKTLASELNRIDQSGWK